MYQLALVLLKDEAASKDVVSDVFADVLDGDVELLPDKAEATVGLRTQQMPDAYQSTEDEGQGSPPAAT